MSPLSRGAGKPKFNWDEIPAVIKQTVLYSTMTCYQKKMCIVLNVLKHNPRATLADISRIAHVPVSTVHDVIKSAKKVLDFELVYTMKEGKRDETD